MPELPEVETIKLGLEKKIIGAKIVNIEILNPKSFLGDPKTIIGVKITGVFRRAKMLGLCLTGPATPESRRPSSLSLRARRQEPSFVSPARTNLLFHLKMSGQIILEAVDDKRKADSVIGGHPTKDMLGLMPNKSTRVIITLDTKGTKVNKVSKLYFNDQRKFGWIKIVDSEECKVISDRLGPEPLEKEFNWQILKTQLKKRKNTAVKVAILDQAVVSGVGNIYACEACFLAKIHPKKLVKDLADDEIKKLCSGIKESMEKSLEYGGSSKQHYFNESGEKGYFLEVANVYDRKGKPCRKCRTPIEKITLMGRGTYYCPNCQS